jgi:hypothetical protein
MQNQTTPWAYLGLMGAMFAFFAWKDFWGLAIGAGIVFGLIAIGAIGEIIDRPPPAEGSKTDSSLGEKGPRISEAPRKPSPRE